MNIREALRTMSPSLTLQRAAADEIARLDAQVRDLCLVVSNVLTDAQLDGPIPALGGRTARRLWSELSPTSRANVPGNLPGQSGATEGV